MKKKLIQEPTHTGLSSNFSEKIAELLLSGELSGNDEVKKEILTGRLIKIKKAIQSTLIKA